MSAQRARNAEQLNAAMLAALPELVRQWLPGGEQQGDTYIALNPRRNDRNLGSFQINTCTGEWRDHAIGVGGGNPVSLYAYLFAGGDYKAAFKALANDPMVTALAASGAMAPLANVATPLKRQAEKLARVRRVYGDAVGLTGMPAATYLHGRGLRPIEAWDGLRASVQHFPGIGACPVLLAPIDDLEGSLIGLHRTYLTLHGQKLGVPDPRRTLGYVKGGAIRLGHATDELIICEGLEDGLSLFQQMDGAIAVWVAGEAAFLSLMMIPPEISKLTVAADNDEPGERAALKAANTFSVGNRDVRIMHPDPAFKDFNDQLQGIRRD